MCTETKCCCLKLETGTLIFGIISFVINGTLILAIIGITMLYNVNYMETSDYVISENGYTVEYHDFNLQTTTNVNLVLFAALLKSAISVTFTVLLCNGVTKRKPAYILAYYIYGLVMSVLGTAIVVIMMLLGYFTGAFFIIVGLIVYTLILHMVNMTRYKLSSGEVYGFNH